MSDLKPPPVGALSLALEWIVSICLVSMMLMTFADVLGRYLFGAPIFGAAEMIQFMLAGSVFAGLSLVSLRDAHIAVDLFSPALAQRFPVAHRLSVDLVTIGGLCIIGFQLGRIGIDALETGRRTIVLEWPQAAIVLPSAGLCLAAAGLQAAVTIEALKQVRTRR